MNESENIEKTPEELYLDELYSAMETGEVPDGMIPLHVPPLNDPNQEFRTINLPVKRKKTFAEHIAGAAITLSSLYLIAGMASYFKVLDDAHLKAEIKPLLTLVFVFGAVTAAAAAVLCIPLKSVIKPFWRIWPFGVFAVCAAMIIAAAQL
ncbi:MAG: hypothetical protein FWH16_02345 [Oscillospiraceae bacterium]|nr:hypothetical protein [Oscillospiraceae bacterium]